MIKYKRDKSHNYKLTNFKFRMYNGINDRTIPVTLNVQLKIITKKSAPKKLYLKFSLLTLYQGKTLCTFYYGKSKKL